MRPWHLFPQMVEDVSAVHVSGTSDFDFIGYFRHHFFWSGTHGLSLRSRDTNPRLPRYMNLAFWSSGLGELARATPAVFRHFITRVPPRFQGWKRDP